MFTKTNLLILVLMIVFGVSAAITGPSSLDLRAENVAPGDVMKVMRQH